MTIALCAAVVFGAILLQWSGVRRSKPTYFGGNLRELVPTRDDAKAWTVDFRPIADSPEMITSVAKVLGYDDAIFVVYRKADVHISVYMAYWSPGKKMAKEIGGHTPDVCWPAAGWKRTLRETHEGLAVGHRYHPYVTEHRVFEIGGQAEHVVFWHIVDGTVHSYRTGMRPPWYWLFRDAVRWRLNILPEQGFVRISSNLPYDSLLNSEITQHVLDRVFSQMLKGD